LEDFRLLAAGSSTAICCHVPDDALAIWRGEFRLRPGLSNQSLCLGKPHAECAKDSQQHHGAAMDALLTVNIDSGFWQLESGEGEVHDTFK